MNLVVIEAVIVCDFVPQGVANRVVQALGVVRLHKQRIFKQCNSVRVEARPSLALAQWHALIQPKQRLVWLQVAFAPLLFVGKISHKYGYVLHTVAVRLRQAIKRLVDQFLKFVVSKFKHSYTKYSIGLLII